MKLKSDVDFTYMGYLHNVCYANDQTEEEEVYKLLSQFKQLHLNGLAFLPAFFILDYTRRSYLVMTDSIKNVLKYDARELMVNGLDFALEKVQKDYFNIANTKVFPETFRFLQNVSPDKHPDYIFSFTNQYKDYKNNWVKTLQKGIFITSRESGMPLYSITMIMDITAYKRDNIIVHAVEKINRETNSIELLETNYFYPYEEDALLTRQEKNIVKWMADGLSTKMIADKLYLSENTINAHRKNMLRKTNTKNAAQLIAFVIRNNII